MNWVCATKSNNSTRGSVKSTSFAISSKLSLTNATRTYQSSRMMRLTKTNSLGSRCSSSGNKSTVNGPHTVTQRTSSRILSREWSRGVSSCRSAPTPSSRRHASTKVRSRSTQTTSSESARRSSRRSIRPFRMWATSPVDAHHGFLGADSCDFSSSDAIFLICSFSTS